MMRHARTNSQQILSLVSSLVGQGQYLIIGQNTMALKSFAGKNLNGK